MAIKIEITDEEAHALLAYHATEISKFPHGERKRSARVHDIMKRIERSREKETEDYASINQSTKEPETQKAPIAAAWPNS